MAKALSHEWAVERSTEILEHRAQRRRQNNGGGGRRRGRELEDAILSATWAELLSGGYARLTYDSVARGAETSRAVIYRRWPTLSSLVSDAIARQSLGSQLPLPDTGNLRDDLIAFMQGVASLQADLVALASVRLSDHFNGGVPNQQESQTAFLPSTDPGLPSIYLRAQQRGEVNLTGVPQRVLNLPGDLMLGDILARMRPPTDDDIEAIVDDIFYPVLRAYGALPGA